MKKKLLILSACIGLILACFPFTLCAEEDPESDLGVSAPLPQHYLDDYFYDNYTLLPYLTGSGNYINTGINPSNNLRIDLQISGLDSTTGYIFGTREGNNVNELGLRYVTYNAQDQLASNQFRFYNNSSTSSLIDISSEYYVYQFTLDKNNCYLNNAKVYEFTDTSFSSNYPISIFCCNSSGTNSFLTNYNLYYFRIYDYTANNGEGAYVRYYYPAMAKSSGILGLYDSVSKTFVTTGNSVPFEAPEEDKVIGFQISSFITAGLSWIGDILDFAITEPLIICFMAIGLAGAMFRWGRRLVHF